jgi:hypothetical protein
MTAKYKITDKTILIKLLAFVIVKANINNLKSHLRFMAWFRHKTTISSEEDYYLSLIFQAIEFIDKLNYTHLKLSKSEFIEFCDEFDKRELLKSKNGVHNGNNKDGNNTNDENLLNLLNKSISEREDNFTFTTNTISLSRTNNIEPILENRNDGILNLPLDQLYSEYCTGNFNEIPLSKFECMRSDFKIILKLVESLKSEYKNENNNVINNTNNTNINVDTHTNNTTKNNNTNLIDLS